MNEKSCKSVESPKKVSTAAQEVVPSGDPSASLSPNSIPLPPIQVHSNNRNEFRAPSVPMLSPSTPASVQMMSPQTPMQGSPPSVQMMSPPSVQMMSPPSVSMMSPPMPKPQLSPKQPSLASSVGPQIKSVLNQMPSNGTNVTQMVANNCVNSSQSGHRPNQSTTIAQNNGQLMSAYTQPSPQIPNSNFIQSQINPNNNQYYNQNVNNNSNNQQFFNCNTNVYYNYNQFQPMNGINAWNHNSGKILSDNLISIGLI